MATRSTPLCEKYMRSGAPMRDFTNFGRRKPDTRTLSRGENDEKTKAKIEKENVNENIKGIQGLSICAYFFKSDGWQSPINNTA